MSRLRLVGYFTSWGVDQRSYDVLDIPGSLLTHVNYAFANVSPNGECVLEDPDRAQSDFDQFRILKARFPHLRVLLSVGGWTFSKYFSEAVRTQLSRERFVNSCLRVLRDHPYLFDGFDFDWEYPGGGGLEGNGENIADRDNFTLFLSELRWRASQIDLKDLLVTIAIPANERACSQFDLLELDQIIDWFNVMTYDFAGAWSTMTALHAPLFSDPLAPSSVCAGDVLQNLKDILPANKLTMGIPFYGRGWSGVQDRNHGLYQPYQSIADGDTGDGCFSYRTLTSRTSSLDEFWNPGARSPWLYSSADHLMISHENTQSIGEKCAFIGRMELGGAMVWELSLDDEKHTLLRALHEGLRQSEGTASP